RLVREELGDDDRRAGEQGLARLWLSGSEVEGADLEVSIRQQRVASAQGGDVLAPLLDSLGHQLRAGRSRSGGFGSQRTHGRCWVGAGYLARLGLVRERARTVQAGRAEWDQCGRSAREGASWRVTVAAASAADGR